MASAAQIQASRQNAAQSTGPTTVAGKARSALNALTHGATSRRVVLPHECEAEFQAFSEAILRNHAPADEHERRLATQLAVTAWRVERLYRIETALLESRLNARLEAESGQIDPDTALGQVFTDPEEAGKLRLILRYIAGAERAHRQVLAELQSLQRARQEREEKDAEQENTCERTASQECATVTPVVAPITPLAAVGFVSQQQPEPARKRTEVAKGVWLLS